jgi:hypothetical protein
MVRELPSVATRVGSPRIVKRGAVQVDLRWQRWHDGWRNADRELRYYGTCMVCSRNLWAFTDGENDPRGPLGDNALWSVAEDEDGPASRTCAICANDHDRYDQARAIMRVQPPEAWRVIEWPEPVELPAELTEGDEPEPEPEPTYRIVRRFMRDEHESQVVKTGLSLEEAQAHCHDPETSSSTAQGTHEQATTERFGPWFDSYEEE